MSLSSSTRYTGKPKGKRPYTSYLVLRAQEEWWSSEKLRAGSRELGRRWVAGWVRYWYVSFETYFNVGSSYLPSSQQKIVSPMATFWVGLNCSYDINRLCRHRNLEDIFKAWTPVHPLTDCCYSESIQFRRYWYGAAIKRYTFPWQNFGTSTGMRALQRPGHSQRWMSWRTATRIHREGSSILYLCNVLWYLNFWNEASNTPNTSIDYSINICSYIRRYLNAQQVPTVFWQWPFWQPPRNYARCDNLTQHENCPQSQYRRRRIKRWNDRCSNVKAGRPITTYLLLGS